MEFNFLGWASYPQKARVKGLWFGRLASLSNYRVTLAATSRWVGDSGVFVKLGRSPRSKRTLMRPS